MPDLTTRQAAHELQLKPETVALYAESGRFPGAWKLGGRWRIPPEDLAALKPDTASILPARNARSRAQQRRTA